ncbi:MAG: tRNA (guanosine(37)-N1)-methyltransferase TrmD [Sedimenticola sp.]|uniref:tRNA (guanine-N(1)-)-methyltransferase n=1 Tax=Sedimenticola thiotaurini TaxID=1543721 RepID=A0A558CXU2_9GAMM|nr:tRNA (guanosine(37)-N1)-methyltransferase TrmD [Sedimenticola sp.]TVT53598.1 MAG: tRNA (guanosine(37)-N1)-methyltransferase TrmD [Sedimenticola thiotaurini]MCW8881519.1 tRNA (guanosine(37)-N1)-methyltransferase TrmD [Sedimenticola sp.]MCW8947764.1 tRNA (guanosine(37)-N1)-methyltransferase TrmD [Sedimenticola sp.]MCW8950681.1 tRNA (guanosine(37)-N1)-methyltransferase TrmD [Sedimenticola sp.]
MRFDVVTLFPDMFRAMIGEGVTGRAVDKGQVSLGLWNPRDYTADIHRTVDDRPYGGGPGMVMKIEPLRAAIEQAKVVSPDAKVAYLSPQGRRFDQAAASEIAQRSSLILLAGRYEGIDERLISRSVDEEWSIGDYVLSGGELPALVMMDAVIRLLPGVLGAADSAEQDSFSDGLLDCPHYTRPEDFEGDSVPSVLMGGNHELIRRWRLQQSLGRTWQRRPDLLEGRSLTQEEEFLLNEFIEAHKSAD